MASTPSQRSRWLPRTSTNGESSTQGESSFSAQQEQSEAPTSSSRSEYRSLNIPQSATAPPKPLPTQAQPSITATPAQNAPPREVRTCWICQQDDTDDTLENSEWRTPCPCSLTAHDSCLLEWVASEEAPRPGEVTLPRKLVCPQCQFKINIQRPNNYLVSAIDTVQSVAKRMMLPAAISAGLGCLYSGLVVYGTNAMTLVLGVEEATSILGTGVAIRGWPRSRSNHFTHFIWALMDPFFPNGDMMNPALFLITPLIAPSLVLLRTKYADKAFAIALPLYFIRPTHRNITWPPSLGLTLSTIPYIQKAYNELYNYTFAEHEKRWNLAVQRTPREGESAEGIAAAARAEADGEPHAVLELEWIEEEVNREDAEAQQQANLVGPPVDGEEHEGVAPQPNPLRANGNGFGNNNHMEIQHDININSLASTVLGALFFPAISSVMGSLIKYALPSHLTTSRMWKDSGFFQKSVVQRGLLREKWGRSIIGGCLFVVLKDAVVLYCKWKKARDFGKRKVLDYVGERGKRVPEEFVVEH